MRDAWQVQSPLRIAYGMQLAIANRQKEGRGFYQTVSIYHCSFCSATYIVRLFTVCGRD
ncbi:hypothetical protein [Youxingia wuxianensis]|uniref:Uncharacterized protein n=1 Tax=Youxingia wuxianensis TaxID=2763678 RepID=A0A926ES25_9FIRM|nr:hypothetical protein [Youxingia wuxianensis]MBC8585577.1 hypothetical protein [Youxingia wuxianensis]